MPLLELPNEVLARIIAFLETESPTEACLLSKPEAPWSVDEAQTWTGRRSGALQQISQTCRLIRSLALPGLFQCAVLCPSTLDRFLAFVRANQLRQHVDSVVAHLQGPYNHVHPAWWARLLNEVPARHLTVIASSEVFNELAGISQWTSDSWAFNMPVQILRLEQSAAAAGHRIDCDNLPNFLAARPWTSMLVNEGSSLTAYTTYEFFLRRTPSLLTTVHFNDLHAGETLFAGLESFAFVAIFPFYNHVDEILKCIRRMTSLRKLFVKLCPEPESTVLHDEIESVGGHMDVNDPWNECETSWMLIAHTVVFLTIQGRLRELCMDDVKVDGVRSSLENSLNARLQDWWTYQGATSGRWLRTVMPA